MYKAIKSNIMKYIFYIAQYAHTRMTSRDFSDALRDWTQKVKIML